MIDRATHCDRADLQVILFGDEESDAYRRSASHIEKCHTCQDRLTSLAADPGSWQEISGMLEELTVQTGPLAHEDETPPIEYLSPPSHPEMLGRLGRYEIERMIGKGGMGIVWKGFDTELNRPVAIKVLARHLAHSGAARQRFAREARAAAAVVHEHVVAIHNVETDREIPFLVMQYVAGESLQARVERVGPLDVKEILRISSQAAAGLASAHGQGLIHRDVKPANILLEHGVDRALLTDFGLARTVDDASLTTTGVLTGTPHYMSPEQASSEATDPRTDLFSLGAVIYFMATGRPPFRAEKAMGVLHRICHERHRPLWEVNPEIPDELSDIVDRLLEKQPSRRLGSATVLESQLRRILANLQHHGSQSGWLRWSRRIRRQRWLRTAATMLVVILIASSLLIPPLAARLRVKSPLNQSDDKVSLEILRMASPSEQEAFTRQLREIDDQLRQCETLLRRTSFAPWRDDVWHTELGKLEEQVKGVVHGVVQSETSEESTTQGDH